jgi:uncharacterized protein YutE (UPF0331/DUF86 family)
VNSVIIKKLEMFDRYLELLKARVPEEYDQFIKDIDKMLVVERLLQILIEIIIDISDRIVSLEGWGPSETSSRCLEILYKKGVLKSFEPYQSMVKFRNFIVHQYDEVNPKIVFNIARNYLKDLSDFKDEILNYVDARSR